MLHALGVNVGFYEHVKIVAFLSEFGSSCHVTIQARWKFLSKDYYDF